CTLVDRLHRGDVDAEFVFTQTRRNVRMRRGINVRIHANCYPRAFVSAARDRIDQFDFRFGLGIEVEDAGIEGVLDLFGGLAAPSEYTPAGVASRLEHAKQFSPGYDVEARAGAGE